MILKRLNQQLTSKDFWNEAIIFISKDENLNKAHIKYGNGAECKWANRMENQERKNIKGC